MTNDRHELDLGSLFEAVCAYLPVQLRGVFSNYLSLSAHDVTALVLPDDAITHLALQHPRLPGSAQRGIHADDPIALLPNTLSADELRNTIPDSTNRLIASLADPGNSDRIVACLEAVASGAEVDLVVPHTLVGDPKSRATRQLLLAGQVTDLFTANADVYIGWLKQAPEPGHRTQAVEVPPPDEWPEFEDDLKTWMPLWRWGDLVDLPADKPWAWQNLEPDIISMLLRLKDAMANATTSTLPATTAYTDLGFIELGLRYLVELRLGQDPDVILPLLPATPREAAEVALRTGNTRSVLSHIYFINYKHILGRAWPRFEDLFRDSSEKSLLSKLQAANEIRNRADHPTKLARITSQDLNLLKELAELIDQAITVAEAEPPG